MPPDITRLHPPPTWISNDEVVYPVKSPLGAFAKANVNTGHAEICKECTSAMFDRPGAGDNTSIPKDAKAPDRKGIPAEAELVAQSTNGDLAVYKIDTPDKLALMFKKKDAIATLFDNDRRPKAAAAQK